MSFDRLQSLIKTTKCPMAVELAPALEETGEEFPAFISALMDALRGTVPALRFPLEPYLRLGWQGVKVLEELLAQAKEKGFFLLLDAPLSSVPTPPLPSFPADCLIVSGYLGSDGLIPLLEACKKEDKCLFVQARTANPSAGELQDLVAGDRLVYQVAGDLAHRLGKDHLGPLGYSRAGIGVEGVWPSDLRTLRKRWERSFLLVSGAAGDVRFAFDQYGRGAIVSTAEPVLAVRQQGGDVTAAKDSAMALRDELKRYITIL